MDVIGPELFAQKLLWRVFNPANLFSPGNYIRGLMPFTETNLMLRGVQKTILPKTGLPMEAGKFKNMMALQGRFPNKEENYWKNLTLSHQEKLILEVVSKKGAFTKKNLAVFAHQIGQPIKGKALDQLFEKLKQSRIRLESLGILETRNSNFGPYSFFSKPVSEPKNFSNLSPEEMEVMRVVQIYGAWNEMNYKLHLMEETTSKAAYTARLSNFQNLETLAQSLERRNILIRDMASLDTIIPNAEQLDPSLITVTGSFTPQNDFQADILKIIETKGSLTLETFREFYEQPEPIPLEQSPIVFNLTMSQEDLQAYFSFRGDPQPILNSLLAFNLATIEPNKRVQALSNIRTLLNEPTFKEATELRETLSDLESNLVAKMAHSRQNGQSTFKARAREARAMNIADFLRNHDVPIVKDSRNWYRVEGFAGLMIRDNGFHHLSEGTKGNTIDFLLNYGKDLGIPVNGFNEAVEALLPHTPIPTNVEGETILPSSFQEPKRIDTTTLALAPNEKRAFAYLVKKRGLPPETVKELLKQDLLAQDKQGNALFLGKDFEGILAHVTKRGTLDVKQFKATHPNSNPNHAFRIMDQKSSTLVVTESAIDAISKKVLNEAKGINANYQSLAGMSQQPIDTFFKNRKINRLVLALNRDKPGLKRAGELAERYARLGVTVEVDVPPFGNDWNDVLREDRSQTTLSDDKVRKYLSEFLDSDKPHSKPKSRKESVEVAYQRRIDSLLSLNDKGTLSFNHPDLVDFEREVELRTERSREHEWTREIRNPLSTIQLETGFLTEAQVSFLHHIGLTGVAEQKNWYDHMDTSLLVSQAQNIMNGRKGTLLPELRKVDKLKQKGLGALVKQGLIQSNEIILGTKNRTFPKRFYTLTEKGESTLNGLGLEGVYNKGHFKKKPNELRHELLVSKLLIQERHRLFLEGKRITSIKTDSHYDRQNASEMERIRRSWLKVGGISKEEYIRYNGLKNSDKNSLTEEQKSILSELDSKMKEGLYTPKMEYEFQRLKHLHDIGELKTTQEQRRFTSYTSKRNRIEKEYPGSIERYHQIKSSAQPDLVIEFETILEDSEGDLRVSQASHIYEVDAGDYSLKEIRNKLAQGGSNWIWATPGGLNSTQGQKIARAIVAAKAHGYVMAL